MQKGKFRIEGGRQTDQINVEQPIAPIVNSLMTLIFEDNYMKILEKDFVKIKNDKHIRPNFRLVTSAEFAKRKHLENQEVKPWFKDATFERGSLNDIWKISTRYLDKNNKTHGAVFPEELVAKVLQNFSKEGNIVYDPFMGTGTTAVVCKKLKRKFIGSEINQEYTKDCNKRLDNIGFEF